MPPGARGTVTASLEVFRRGPSSDGATPRTQNELVGSVSQTPLAPVRRSSSWVTVRAPELGARVRTNVPSRAPSGARAPLPWPTRSRVWPVKARLSVGVAPVAPMVVDAEAVAPSANVAVRVNADPGANRPAVSAAKRTAVPPGARGTVTASLEVFRRGPSSDGATPRTQKRWSAPYPRRHRPRAAELQLGDGAGAGARGEGQDKRAIEGAVGGTGAIALADTITGLARKGQAQRGSAQWPQWWWTPRRWSRRRTWRSG